MNFSHHSITLTNTVILSKSCANFKWPPEKKIGAQGASSWYCTRALAPSEMQAHLPEIWTRLVESIYSEDKFQHEIIFLINWQSPFKVNDKKSSRGGWQREGEIKLPFWLFIPTFNVRKQFSIFRFKQWHL